MIVDLGSSKSAVLLVLGPAQRAKSTPTFQFSFMGPLRPAQIDFGFSDLQTSQSVEIT